MQVFDFELQLERLCALCKEGVKLWRVGKGGARAEEQRRSCSTRNLAFRVRADSVALGLGCAGDSGVGKSCLMHHFLNDACKSAPPLSRWRMCELDHGKLTTGPLTVRDPSPHTIGVEFSSTLMRLPSSTPAATIAGSRVPNSKTLKVQLWDTVSLPTAFSMLLEIGNSSSSFVVRLVKSGFDRSPATTTEARVVQSLYMMSPSTW